MGVRGTRTPIWGSGPRPQGKARKKAGSPLRTVKGRGSIFLPCGQKNLHPWAQRAPLDGPTLGGPLAPPTDQPLPGAGPPSAPVYHPGPGLRPPFGGDHGGGLARPLRSPRPALAGRAAPPPFPPASLWTCLWPAAAGTGARFREGLQEAQKRPQEGRGCSWGLGYGGQGSRVKEGPARGPGWRFPAQPEILPGLDAGDLSRRLWQGGPFRAKPGTDPLATGAAGGTTAARRWGPSGPPARKGRVISSGRIARTPSCIQ